MTAPARNRRSATGDRGSRRSTRPGRACAGTSRGRLHRAHGGLAAARADADRRPPVRRAQQARGDRDRRRHLGPAGRHRGRSSRRRASRASIPYDLILVTAGEDCAAAADGLRSASALKVHKVAYDVALELPPFRVVGTVYLHPGLGAGAPAGPRPAEMFVPVTDAVATAGRRRGERPGRRGHPRQPLLPARRRAGGQAHGRAAQKLRARPMGGVSLAGPRSR